MSASVTVRLNSLRAGEEAEILGVEAEGPVRRRLLEMGFIRASA